MQRLVCCPITDETSGSLCNGRFLLSEAVVDEPGKNFVQYSRSGSTRATIDVDSCLERQDDQETA